MKAKDPQIGDREAFDKSNTKQAQFLMSFRIRWASLLPNDISGDIRVSIC